MNISDIVKTVSKDTGLTTKQAKDSFSKIFNLIQKTVTGGKDVNILGFGSFKLVKRSARTGRNPRTMEVIEIPERNAVVFRPSKVFLVKNMACGKKKPGKPKPGTKKGK